MKKSIFIALGCFLFLPLVLLAQETEPAAATLEVTEAKLGKSVVDREIAEETTTFSVDERAYLWLRVKGGPSEPITVTWKLGEKSYTTELSIGAASWRTWAYKTVAEAGEWTVTVADSQGNVLKELTFTVQ